MDPIDAVFQSISDSIGVPVAGLKFLISLLLSIPVSYVLKNRLDGESATKKHIYFTLTGFAFALLNYKFDCYHYLITIVLNYVLLQTVGGSAFSVALSFLLNMGYLLAAYMFVATDGYDIIWTTPHCILVLRMIAIAFDLYDGHRPQDKLSKEQQTLNITKAPSLLELFSCSFYLGGFFAGPQFSFRMFLDFVNERGIYEDIYGKDPPNRLGHVVQTALRGLLYVGIYALFDPLYSPHYIASPEFEALGMGSKIWQFCIFGYVFYFKYIGFWLITESVCIAGGLSYNGKDSNGQHKWDALIGVRDYELLTTVVFKDHITSFNLTTNLWAGRYVFKRCRFLGNRNISQVITLFFLATWHGLFIGYYHCFMMEMVYLIVERQVTEIVQKTKIAEIVALPGANIPVYILMKAYITFFWTYAISSFIFLRVDKIHHIYKQFYYFGHIWNFLWLVLYALVIAPRLRKKEKKEEKDNLKKSE